MLILGGKIKQYIVDAFAENVLVCGSGHCHIVPIWAKDLGKNVITAFQASRRGGTLYCKLEGSDILMSGKASLYSISELFIKKFE